MAGRYKKINIQDQMETTTANVIEIRNHSLEQDGSSGQTLLTKKLNSALGSILSLAENNCVIKVYNGDSDKAAGKEMSSGAGAVCISTGSGRTSSDYSNDGLSAGTKNIVKIVKPQNVHVPANQNNLATVHSGTVEVATGVSSLETECRSKTTFDGVHTKTLLHGTEDRQFNGPTADQVSNESSAEKKSPVIMFKWGSVKKPFRCQICDMSFTDGNLLRAHLEKHNSSRKEPSKPFPCNLCIKSFQSSRSLERHQFIHSGQSQKRCKYCYKVFANKENLDKHVQMHNGNKAHSCLFCNEQFTSRPSLEKHIATHKMDKNYKCHICERKFNRKDTLDRHLLTHDVGKRNKHQCVECKRSFSYLFALKRHVRSVHGGEPDGKVCEVCGKFIKNRENITRHMQLHEGIRPYQCQECGRRFTQKQHLVDHMVTHSNALPFECKFCLLSFRYRRSLGRHLKKHFTVHAETQQLECALCNSMFSSEKEIIHHVGSIHLNFKQCLMCNETFAEEKTCIRHMLTVHDLPVAVVNKTMNLLNKSTETDPTGPECNADLAGQECNTYPAGPECNSDPAGQECNTYTAGPECNTDPAGQECNTYPDGPECNTDPSVQECNTDSAGPECNTDPSVQECNTDPAGPECNTVSETYKNGDGIGAENTTADVVDSGIEKHEHGLEYTTERIEDFCNEENIPSKEETVSEGQQVIYILYDNGKELCEVQNMDVDQIIAQAGLPVQDQESRCSLDGKEVVQVTALEEQSFDNELDTDNKSNMVQISEATANEGHIFNGTIKNEDEIFTKTTENEGEIFIETTENEGEIFTKTTENEGEIFTEAIENEAEESADMEIAENYSNLYQTNEIDGTNVKGVTYTYNVVVPGAEKEGGNLDLETEESKFAAERSQLLQSLIDYAERMQEEELSISSTEATCSSETKI